MSAPQRYRSGAYGAMVADDNGPWVHWSDVQASDDDVTLRLVCAWCTKEMAAGAEPVSHGICRDCGDKLMDAHYKGRAFEPVLRKEV